MTMLEGYNDLESYFSSLLKEVIQDHKVDTSPEVEFYLVNILSKAKAETATEALVCLMQKAQEVKNLGAYKKLGDTALAKASLFEEYAKRKAISMSYIEDIGTSAYKTASSLAFRDRRSSVFYDLGDRFQTYTKVLKEVKEATELSSEDPIQLYEKYLTTNSPKVLKRLNKLGLVIITSESEA